ncbi:MAG: hypothetical protein Q4D08_03420 [Clostridia bacterium]|nr:hypothetical protein [Clostridia bacterium]
MRASRKIKSALFGGALLTIITVMLMLGSTMAWFQDTEVVINTYTFGNLDVDIVEENDGQIVGATTLQFVKPDGGEYQAGAYLFEPGATFQLKEFYIKNSGDVALKYRLKLDTTGATGQKELLDSMTITATMGDGSPALPFLLDSETRTLAAGKMDGPVRIYIHMKEAAGNEYQGLSVEGLVVKVIAVQDEGIPEADLDKAFNEATQKPTP